jgi:hypothetical protein
MAQKTNLNVSPYYDDFDSLKDFYKVLFNPGRPVQARELTTLQSILQNQLESFGSNVFKDGSVVVPGNIVYDGEFYAIKLNPSIYGTNIALYADQLIGKKIIGQTSGVSAAVQYILNAGENNNVEYTTLYVKYLNSDNNFKISTFSNGESIECTENITYGTTTINSGTAVASLISTDANSIGSAASIGNGIYFIRGFFARVSQQTIILDEYTNTPSYRIGLRIFEQIISAKDDSSLYDNAKGFSNYAAPGSDRLKIELVLTKKDLDDLNDTDFVELLRVENGSIKKIQTKTSYNLIRDYLAQRTYDESGDYAVRSFTASVHNSLNNRVGNDGLYFSGEKTEDGNTPNDNLMCVKVSPGKAYIRGYDVEKVSTTVIDVAKPRDTATVPTTNISFGLGNNIRVNNVGGAPRNRGAVELYNQRKSSTSSGTGTKIGDARVYICNLTDSAYISTSTNWDLYLYDVQTYTEITLNQPLSSLELPATSFIRGKSSGASGYAVSAGGNSTVISLRQTSGNFILGEQISINEITLYPRTIAKIKVYAAQDVRSLYQATSTGFPVAFTADAFLDKIPAPGFTALDKVTIDTSGNITCPGKFFTGIKTDSIIRYQKVGFSTETFNRVVSIGQSGISMTVAAVPTVLGVCDGTLPSTSTQTNFSLGISQIRNPNSGALYQRLNNQNIASVNLTSSNLAITDQITGQSTNASGVLTFSLASVSSGITSSFFQAFDEERYSVHYSDGTIAPLTSDKFTLSGNTITITGLLPNQTNVVVNVGLLKQTIRNKVKVYNRSQTLNINLSKYPQSGSGISSSIVDGLTYNQFYGLRVQDEEICLYYPDVAKLIGVYESLEAAVPVLDRFVFSATASVDTAAIIGENIVGSTSKAVARIVSKPSSNTLSIAYLNALRFVAGETITFSESNIVTPLQSITLGKYKDITSNFTLDKGQREQYYDYSRLIRNSAAVEPSRPLLVVFDYYSVPSGDQGDVFTVASYAPERYENEVPILNSTIRATDVLDFRPQPSTLTTTNSSPFDFSQRTNAFGTTSPKFIVSPDETSLVGYSYYLPRIDKLSIDKLGSFILTKGISADIPKTPLSPDETMDIATISLPAYLYGTKGVTITYQDNKRYTMRDIGRIEDRVTTLEKITSLSLLEVDTKSLQVQDSDGFNRFKTGFFVDSFKNNDFISPNSEVTVDPEEKTLKPVIASNSLKSLIASANSTSDTSLDLSVDFDLIDSNTVKTSNRISLKYSELEWIKQSLATQVENVNPFNVVTYTGTIKLTPSIDTWVRTINLVQNRTSTSRVANPGRRGQTVVTGSSSVREFIGTKTEDYMRSRNTEFSIQNLKPKTRYYQFFDGSSGVDFIPKLIEIANDSTLQNYGASAAFSVGETVVGYYGGSNIFRARVCSGNHKTGQYNSPSKTYGINPYSSTTEILLSTYSSSSKVLNIDTFALAEEAQGFYSGYLVVGMKLVGQTSGAVAYVKDLRLISDNFGDLIGSFFLRDPLTTPPPQSRFLTGTKTYKVTSSSTNSPGLPGSTSISTAETNYTSSGIVNTFLTTNTTFITEFYDPLAQSFTVGANIGDNSSSGTVDEDKEGAYLTAVDLFFATKDSGDAPLTVEIRTMELGTPTRTVVGKSKVLRPSDINTSSDASVATKVTFDYPIFLSPGREYSIVLLSPNSDAYTVWIAEMGKKTVGNNNVDNVIYSTQFATGSLFKSQNGSIWTANQYQDLKFKLYKAKFVTTPSTVYFYNPTLDGSNGYVKKLQNNPLRTYPRKLKVGITTITNAVTIGILTTGRKVSESSKTYNYGYVVGTGCSAYSIGITTGGVNYTTQSNVSTYPITGQGSGLTVNITASNGIINSVTPVLRGNGYQQGDVLGIVTSTSGSIGKDAQITVTGITTGIDTLYLTNVQGQSFTVGANPIYYDDTNVVNTLLSNTITASTPQTDQNSGNFLQVNHYNHGMYAKNNRITLSDVLSNTPPAPLQSSVTVSATSFAIGSANTSNFVNFEGMPVSATNPGYAKIENEIIKYESVGNGVLQTVTRGIDSTLANSYDINDLVYKYELNGVSLRRINTTHKISDFGIEIDKYYVEIDRSANGVNRSADNSPSNFPQLQFQDEELLGGNASASENIQFDSLTPNYTILNPGSSTSVSASIRTVSGTSVNGSELSFVDQGFESVELNKVNKLSSTRIVCSKVNEQTYLTGLPRSKSFTTALVLSTQNSNLSPQIFLDGALTEFRSNRINSPITDYAGNNLVKTVSDDPHSAIYISNTIDLKQPATSLKVILTASRPAAADFRVLYSLVRPDSNGINQPFELFPGYDNLVDINGDGFGDLIINPAKNSGRSDAFVAANTDGSFSEYQCTAENLDQFVGYTIKIVMSSTDQSKPVLIKDLRTIAVR